MAAAVIDDLPHLPYFFIYKATFLNLYDKELRPQSTKDLLKGLYLTYLHDSVKKSIRYENYKEMFGRMKSKGELSHKDLEFKFWQYAYKTERLIKIQTLAKLLIPNKSI